MSNYILEVLRASAVWFEPIESVTDCRDTKDPIFLEKPLVRRVKRRIPIRMVSVRPESLQVFRIG